MRFYFLRVNKLQGDCLLSVGVIKVTVLILFVLLIRLALTY